MSRYEIRCSELTKLGYKLDQAKEIARAEEAERQTDALERIADALGKNSDEKTINLDAGLIKTGKIRLGESAVAETAKEITDQQRKAGQT